MKRTLINLVIMCVLLLESALLISCQMAQGGAVPQIAFQYATVRAIQESEEITRDDAFEFVTVARRILEQDTTGTADVVMLAIREQIDWTRLSPESRILVELVFTYARQHIEQSTVSIGSEAARTSALAILGWIEQGATLANPET